MIKPINSALVKKLRKFRNANSHKGENGRVLIIAGSLEYYAPAVLAGMGALRSGADIASLYVPECNFDVTRGLLPDFVVNKYPGENLRDRYCEQIVAYGKKFDSVLIGPGLGKDEKTADAVFDIVSKLHIPTVLDASAILVLKKIAKFPLPQPIVVTPHSNEFKSLVDREINVKEDNAKSIILLRSLSMDLHINVLLKGPVDYISSDDVVVEKNITGNAGMTVGGTGDVLAGVVAGLLAQGYDAFDAARLAAYYVGKAGDRLKRAKGFGYLASEVADEVAVVMA